ncbi:MAG: efflux RND transporter periplasmic adaptor subunit [Azoarcus sp.]|nr:efflux RND transporter periplasmic adaptor subunit [Azoarcus sp.]
MKYLPVLLFWLSSLAFAADWTTRPLDELAVFPEFRAPANVLARDEAKLAAEIGARIVAMPVREGQAVSKGAELVRLDDAAYRIEVERALAQVELVSNRIRLAEAQLAQSRALAGKGFISADGLRIKETELAVLGSEQDAARAALRAARLNLERAVVRAPYAGVVRNRLANVGDLAVPGSALLTFSATGDAEVRARVAEDLLAGLRAGKGWALHAGEAVYPLRLSRISPLIERAGQAREVMLLADAALPPGLAGELRWRSVTPYLPPAYVQQRNGVQGVYVERDGRAVFIELPRAQAGRAAAVDLPPDTRVIDEGRFALALRGDAR